MASLQQITEYVCARERVFIGEREFHEKEAHYLTKMDPNTRVKIVYGFFLFYFKKKNLNK